MQNNGTVIANNLTINSNTGNIYGTGTFKAPTMSLTALGGNIGANTAGTTALSVNSGGTSGLTIAVLATQVSGNGGTVDISDSNAEDVIIDNSFSVGNAAVSFTVASSGNIYTNTPAGTAISSPIISLSASGNIGGNSTATNPLLVTSGGTSGITLSGSGSTVNLQDPVSENIAVGLFNSNGSFALASSGNGSITFSNIVGGSNCALIDITCSRRRLH